MDASTVFCKKFSRELPALKEAPFKGPIGEIIKDNISAQAFNDWIELQIKIINEERLDLSDISGQKRLFERMVEYLGIGDLIS